LIEQLFLIRTLPPWRSNALERLIKRPKLHFLDSGLLSALRGVTDAASGPPVDVGASWPRKVVLGFGSLRDLDGNGFAKNVPAYSLVVHANFYRFGAGPRL